MTMVDVAVTVMDQGRASVNKVIEWNAGYVAGSESSTTSTLSKELRDAELRLLPKAGEEGERRYEGGKARSKQR